MGKEPRIRSQCRGIRRRRKRVLGQRSGAGGTRSRVWSARPYPGEHQRSGVLRCYLKSPSGQRAMDAPTEDEEGGPDQASANAGPTSRHYQDQTAGRNHIPSHPNTCLPHRPSTSARHANFSSRPHPSTSAEHLQHRGQGSGHSTRPQHPRVPGNLHPAII